MAFRTSLIDPLRPVGPARPQRRFPRSSGRSRWRDGGKVSAKPLVANPNLHDRLTERSRYPHLHVLLFVDLLSSSIFQIPKAPHVAVAIAEGHNLLALGMIVSAVSEVVAALLRRSRHTVAVDD